MCEIRTISKVYIDYFLKREKTQKKNKKNLKKKEHLRIKNLNGNCMSVSTERVGVYLESKCIDLKQQ